MIYDIPRKREGVTIPGGEELKLKYFSISKKARLRGGHSKYKSYPRVEKYKQLEDGYFEIYKQIIRANKKRIACLPYID
jgi:hypothetical protein